MFFFLFLNILSHFIFELFLVELGAAPQIRGARAGSREFGAGAELERQRARNEFFPIPDPVFRYVTDSRIYSD
jgi:hypothetical protein